MIKIKLNWKLSCWNPDGKSMWRCAKDAETEFLSYFEDISWFPTEYPSSFDFTMHNGLILPSFDLSKFEYIGNGDNNNEFGSFFIYRIGKVFINVKTYDEIDVTNDKVRHLEEKIKTQKREIRVMQESLERKNKELDAMHYVWCSGGCSGGVHRYDEMKNVELTEEIVKLAEANTSRLRSWLSNYKYRKINK